MSQPMKILACGDVKGQFKLLFNRVDTVNKKTGPYSMLLCVGEFFNSDDDAEWEDVMKGSIRASLPTYILGPTNPSNKKYLSNTSGCELKDNITYLGRGGSFTGRSGLTLAYLSGLDRNVDDLADPDVRFTADDVDRIRQPLLANADFKGVDLLLTNQWPQGVDKYAIGVEGAGASIRGSALISQLALSLKPRYHFSALENVSYERLPYRNHRILQGNAEHVTRFIALADFGNKEKRKYLYAFSISPLKDIDSSELIKQPEDVTESPFRYDASLFKKFTPKGGDDQRQQFFYDKKSLECRKRRADGSTERQHKKPAQPSGPCWFCLGSAEVEKHFVISVGETCYLSLAKGGLTPEHCLIIPIGHHQSMTSAPDDVISEIERFKSSIKKFAASTCKKIVFFERNYKTSHLQIQAVFIPTSMCDDLKETVVGCALSQNIELAELPQYSDLRQIVPAGNPYFFMELPDGEKFLYRIKKGFPIQFGREVLAHSSILNMPERADWKSCHSSKEEETQMAAKFRQGFQKFDFTVIS